MDTSRFNREEKIKRSLEADDDIMQRLHIASKHEIEIMRAQLVRNNMEVAQGIASFPSEQRVQVKSAYDEILETALVGAY